MEELTVKAEEYAAKKTNEVISYAIAQAYADGYRAGYKDCEKDIPVDIKDNKTEYVDLGLPSGTLWAADYEKDGNDIRYLTYNQASQLSIPTKDQCMELFNSCRFIPKNDVFYCIGPNGNTISFIPTGFKVLEDESLPSVYVSYFWFSNDNSEPSFNLARIVPDRGNVSKGVCKEFPGYKIPVRQVLTR